MLSVGLKLATVLPRPFTHEPQRASWQLTRNWLAVLNRDLRLKLAIPRMEMRWRVIVLYIAITIP